MKNKIVQISSVFIDCKSQAVTPMVIVYGLSSEGELYCWAQDEPRWIRLCDEKLRDEDGQLIEQPVMNFCQKCGMPQFNNPKPECFWCGNKLQVEND